MNITKAKHELVDAPLDQEGKRVPAPNVVTILRSGRDEPATKVYGHVLNSEDAKGGLIPTKQFGDIRYWEVREESFSDSEGLFSVIEKWSKDPKAAVIHGGFIGIEAANPMWITPKPYKCKKTGQTIQEPPFPAVDGRGMVVRQLIAMRDRPVVYMMLDVDGWRVRDPDAAGEPLLMAEDYIRHNLPSAFQDVSYTLQMSSSSFLVDCLGRTKKDKGTGEYEEPGLFKGHFFFALDRPMYVGVLNSWIKLLKEDGMYVDPRTVHPNQVCYIAPPVFAYADEGNDPIDGEFDRIDSRIPGIQDPHPEGRLQYVRKGRDAVDCSGIDVVSLAAKADAGNRRSVVKSGRATAALFDQTAADMGMSVEDAAFSRAVSRMIIGSTPRRQVGIETDRGYWIGAVNRAYGIWDLLDTHLADRYLHVGRGRLTFLGSASGSVESAYVCDDQQRIGSTSDSDLVSRTGGPCNAWDLLRLHWFGDLDTDLTQKIQDRPSYKAMLEWARKDKKTVLEYRKMQMTKKFEEQKKAALVAEESLPVAEEVQVPMETRMVVNGNNYSTPTPAPVDLEIKDSFSVDEEEEGGGFDGDGDSIDPDLAGETRFEMPDFSTGAEIRDIRTGQRIDPRDLMQDESKVEDKGDGGQADADPAPATDPAPAPTAPKAEVEEPWYPIHEIQRTKLFSEPWHKRLDMEMTKDGKQVVSSKSINNISVILQNDLVTKNLVYNNFTRSVEVSGPVPWREPGNYYSPGFNDADLTGVRRAIGKRWGFGVSKENMQDCINELENSRKRVDPLSDYLTGLRGRWDGVPRVNRLLVDHMGAEDCVEVRTMTRRFLIAAVARGIKGAVDSRDGVKVDNILVLVGPQNLGKSSFLKELVPVPEWRAEHPPAMTSGKEIVLWMQGRWLIEDAELQAIGVDEKAQTGAKAFITAAVDEIVPKYQNYSRRFARRSLFLGTVDHTFFLKSEGANRRFWPIAVTKSIQTGALRAVADQVWAEAVAALEAGERWWLGDSSPEEAALQDAILKHTRKFVEQSPIQGAVETALVKIGKKEVCIPEVVDAVYPRSRTQPSVDEQRRRRDEVRKCLRSLGWVEGDKKRFGGHGTQTPFRAPAGTVVDFPETDVQEVDAAD